jgi:hypothetical protein
MKKISLPQRDDRDEAGEMGKFGSDVGAKRDDQIACANLRRAAPNPVTAIREWAAGRVQIKTKVMHHLCDVAPPS